MSVRSTLSLAALVASLSAPAFATTLTITSISGTWQDASTGVSGEGTSDITWGKSAGWGQSGYSFDAATTELVAEEETPFVLGTFTHLNKPIYDPFLESVDLELIFTIDGLDDPITSVFSFSHLETLNSAKPCANGEANYTGVNISGCADRVTAVTNEGLTEVFTIGAVNYLLDVTGFLYEGSLMEAFWTQEKASNSAQLVASFSAVTAELPPPPPPPAVPLPAPAFMLLGGLGGLAALRRRKG